MRLDQSAHQRGDDGSSERAQLRAHSSSSPCAQASGVSRRRYPELAGVLATELRHACAELSDGVIYDRQVSTFVHGHVAALLVMELGPPFQLGRGGPVIGGSRARTTSSRTEPSGSDPT